MSKIFISMEFRENRIDFRDPENAKHFLDVKIFEHFQKSLDKFAQAIISSDSNGDF